MPFAPFHRRSAVAAAITSIAASALAPAAGWAQQPQPQRAAVGERPVRPLPASAAAANDRVRTASLPARGLFIGDQLSASARARLTELLVEAIGLRVEVALLVPTGPWLIDGGGDSDRDLTQARLNAIRRFLAERGVNPKHLYVESRIDAKVKEPRLDVQLVGSPDNE